MAVAVLMTAGIVPAAAQSAGALRATVVDASGGAVPGARVSVHADADAVVQSGVSDVSGTVVFADLAPGNYVLRAERDLFAPFAQSITIVAGAEPAIVQVVLGIVGLTEQVAVTGRETLTGALGDRALADLPFSVNVVSGTWLNDQQVRLLLDAVRTDPSVVPGGGTLGSVQTLSLRGLSLNYNANYRRNGLPFNRFSETAYENVEQIELLKGLSGFLHGFAAPGGIVNVVPKRPTDRPLRSARLGITGDTQWLMHLDLSGRLGADRRFGYRVNVAREQGETVIHRVSGDRTLASGNVEWRVSPTISMSLDIEHHVIRPTGQPLYYSLAPGLAVPEPPPLSRPSVVPYATYDTSDTMVGLNGNWLLHPQWTLTARFLNHAHDRDAWFSSGAISNTHGDMMVTVQRDSEQKFPARAASALLQGHVRTGALAHDITVGVNWNTNQSFRGDYAFAPTYASNLLDPADAPATAVTSIRGQYRNASYHEHAVAFSDTMAVAPRVQLMVGIRVAGLDQRNYVFTGAQSTRYARGATSPTAALIVKPRATLTAYLTASGGLEQGGIAGLTTVNAGEVFGPLRSRQIETGVKWEVTPRLAASAALFDIDKGLTYVDVATNRFVQDGRQVNRGLELTLNGRLSDALNVAGGVMFLDATATRTGNARVDGNRPVNVPDLTSTLVVDYTLPVPSRVALVGGVQFIGARDIDVINARTIDGYTLVNLGARVPVALGQRRGSLRVSVDNATNRRYWASGGASLHAGLPRTIRTSFQVDF